MATTAVGTAAAAFVAAAAAVIEATAMVHMSAMLAIVNAVSRPRSRSCLTRRTSLVYPPIQRDGAPAIPAAYYTCGLLSSFGSPSFISRTTPIVPEISAAAFRAGTLPSEAIFLTP